MSTAATPLPSPAKALLGDIKIAHSVFALPFALLGGAMAAWPLEDSAPVTGTALGWAFGLIVAAMVSARTAAMLCNRLFDRHIDARNPRTARRPLAAGAVPVRNYVVALTLALIVFFACCVLFLTQLDNPLPLYLCGPVILWICAYGLFKRFTWLCHLWLGASLALSVPAAAVAVSGDAVAHMPALWLLAAMVLCWVSGFDVIYALQDVDTDLAEGLHSMPSKLGVRRAMWCSRFLHLAAVALLFGAWSVDARFGVAFLAAACVAAALLLVEHLTVRRWGPTKIALTFFTLNGIVSCVIGAAGIWDVLNG